MFSENTPKVSKIFACSKSIALAEKIAEKYGTQLGEIKLSYYSDGEFQPSFEESIRGLRVFLIGSTYKVFLSVLWIIFSHRVYSCLI